MSLEDWADGVVEGRTMIKVAVLCENCDAVSVFEIDVTDYGVPICPACGRHGVYPDGRGADKLNVCRTKGCDRYMKVQPGSECHGTRSGKECGKSIGPISDEDVEGLPITVSTGGDDKDPKIVRRLKALLQKAESYVESSGSHHKSTGGKHSSSATEMHSGAHAVKAQHREKYASEIEEILEEDRDGEIPKSLVKEARDIIGRVRNK